MNLPQLSIKLPLYIYNSLSFWQPAIRESVPAS
jgi:hypothetical protein